MTNLYQSILDCADQIPSIENCIPWLQGKGLTVEADSLLAKQELALDKICLGFPCHGTKSRTSHELADLKKENSYEPGNLAKLWQESKKLEAIALQLDPSRFPADAIAFYRPFHCEPSEGWAIYILIDELLKYQDGLYKKLAKTSCFFERETVLAAVLFEMFHHEFFHHLVECTATTLEIISTSYGPPRKIYFLYKSKRYQNQPGIGIHPDHPLEEALANAYAFNSFSFASFVSHSYLDGLVRFYQKFLPRQWETEGAGYNRASKYMHGDYITGAAELIGMMLASSSSDSIIELPDPNTLLLLGKNVLLNGHVAFEHKADIPTYLVGDEPQIERFRKLIPAPNETYTKLYWPKDTTAIDSYFQQQYKIEKEKAKQSKGINDGRS